VLKKIFLFSALFWTGLILFFCLINASEIRQVTIPNFDKLVHAGFHFVFTMLWFLFFKKKLETINIFRPLVISFVLSFFFGIAIELMQQFFTQTRTADVMDVLANLSGATLVVVLIVVLNAYNGVVNRI
jgi:VanZ family protein